jgi:hypothetical protein
VELESENCKLKAATVEAAEDYEVLQLGDSSLLAERNDFRYRCEDLEDELKKARSNSTASVVALEAKVNSVGAHNAKVAAASDTRLSDFETGLVRDLAGLWKLFIHNVQSIGGLCSSMPEGDPSAASYIRWLFTKVGGLPKMFAGVNENLVSAVVEGALIMAGESVDLNALQGAAAVGGADILPTEQDVRRVACGIEEVVALLRLRLCVGCHPHQVS